MQTLSLSLKQTLKPALTVAVLVLVLYVIQGFAFTEPTQAPPGGNVSPLLSTGPANQTKSGDLTIHRTDATGSIGRIITDQLFTRGGVDINSDNAPIGLIVEKGNVGIGTVSPSQKLDVNGNVHLNGVVYANAICFLDGTCLPHNPGSVSFTNPGTYIWAVPGSVPGSNLSIGVQVWGGGGAGGNNAGQTCLPHGRGAGGGGGGGYAGGTYTVSVGSTLTIVVGAGAGAGTGGSGQQSYIAGLLQAGGGNHGWNADSGTGGTGGAGGGQTPVTGGEGISASGAGGGDGGNAGNAAGTGGAGGVFAQDCSNPDTGCIIVGNLPGGDGKAPGGGGGGGETAAGCDGRTVLGGAGAPGEVVISY